MTQNDKTEIVRSNVIKILQAKGLNVFEAARACGLGRTYFYDFIEIRKTSSLAGKAIEISQGLNVDLAYIVGKKIFNGDPDTLVASNLAGIDNEKLVSNISGNRKSVGLDPGFIPEIDTVLGAGAGGGYPLPSQIVDGERTYAAETVRDQWHLPERFLRDELRLELPFLDILQVRGDSMKAPNGDGFDDGDRVLVNRRETAFRQGGIFAIRDDIETIVKQVELVRGVPNDDYARIICTSLNPRYNPFELVLDGSAEIIGRIVLRISRV